MVQRAASDREDVKTSAAIWFTQDSVQLYNLGAVTVVNSKTVRFTQVPGAHNNQFESGILQDPSFVVPASVYGQLLPPDIWSVIGASLRSGPAATAAAHPAHHDRQAGNRVRAGGRRVRGAVRDPADQPGRGAAGQEQVLLRGEQGAAV